MESLILLHETELNECKVKNEQQTTHLEEANDEIRKLRENKLYFDELEKLLEESTRIILRQNQQLRENSDLMMAIASVAAKNNCSKLG